MPAPQPPIHSTRVSAEARPSDVQTPRPCCPDGQGRSRLPTDLDDAQQKYLFAANTATIARQITVDTSKLQRPRPRWPNPRFAQQLEEQLSYTTITPDDGVILSRDVER